MARALLDKSRLGFDLSNTDRARCRMRAANIGVRTRALRIDGAGMAKKKPAKAPMKQGAAKKAPSKAQHTGATGAKAKAKKSRA
jgi:hypothetical protein